MFVFMSKPFYNAEGVDGGGSGGTDAGGAPDPAAAAAAAAAEKPAAETEPKVIVDGTVPEDKPADEGAKKEGEEGKEPDVKKEGEEEKKPDEFPHKAEEYVFKLPDGAEPDAAQAEQFTTFALDNKVPPELAQKLVDFHADVMGKQVKAWTDTVNGWAEETKSDPEYGGANYDANMALANRALKEFGGDKLGAAARAYGWGNHPEFVRFMFNVGKALGPAGTERGGGNANVGNGVSIQKGLYGD